MYLYKKEMHRDTARVGSLGSRCKISVSPHKLVASYDVMTYLSMRRMPFWPLPYAGDMGTIPYFWSLTTPTHTSKSCQLTSAGVQLSVPWLHSSCSWAPLCWSEHSQEPPAGTQWWTGCRLSAAVASLAASFFLKHLRQLGDGKWEGAKHLHCRLTSIGPSYM